MKSAFSASAFARMASIYDEPWVHTKREEWEGSLDPGHPFFDQDAYDRQQLDDLKGGGPDVAGRAWGGPAPSGVNSEDYDYFYGDLAQVAADAVNSRVGEIMEGYPGDAMALIQAIFKDSNFGWEIRNRMW